VSKEAARELAQYLLLISIILLGMSLAGFAGVDRHIGAVVGGVAAFFATRRYARFLLE
jgi:F0F1-type ATP synthase assembly protein I